MKKLILLSLVLLFSIQVFAQNAIKVTQISHKGTPMIFLPHIGCSSDMWKEIADHYSKTHACYLVNFAGFNDLKPIDSLFTDNYVKDLQTYIKRNHLKNPILVGQNYGAFVAVKTALDKKLKIKAIIASDFYPKLSMVIDTAITPSKLETIKKGIRDLMTLGENDFVAYQKQMAYGMNFLDTTHIENFIQWQLRSDRKTLAETLCEQIGEDLLPTLENNTTPILAFSTWYFAKTYRQMPISDAEAQLHKMYALTPLVKHAVTEDAKDFIPMDAPKWFVTEMDKFLKQ